MSAGTLQIRPLDPVQDAAQIFGLARRLHGDSPAWVAPLEAVERRRLRPSNALFRDAKFAIFGAFRAGELVGTCSVLLDRGFLKEPGVCWFGYFECEPDPAVAAALLDQAQRQAQAWGGTLLRGPRNLTRWEYAGLTVEGFGRIPPMLQGFHPPYYAELLEGLGFVAHHDLLAYEIDLHEPDGRPRPIPPSLADKAAGCDIPGLEVRRARWRSMGADLDRAHQVLNLAYQTVPDVSPMPRAQFMALGRLFLAVADPELLQIGLVHGRPVAFTVCLPEINEALIAARGRLRGLPWALRAARQIRTASFKLIGVDPTFRGTGLHARMVVNVIESVRRAGYQRIDASVIDARNRPMRAVVEGAGMEVYRRYRFYERPC